MKKTAEPPNKVIPPTSKNKLDPAKVQVGDMMSLVYYVKVTSTQDGGKTLIVSDLDKSGMSAIKIQGEQLIQNSSSADQFSEERKVTKTAAAELLGTAFNRPISVCFEKQDGTERVMKGRLVAPEPWLGRSHFEDLELPVTEHRLRLVDHRTIKYVILDGVKHVVK